jgi:hypothetical protein
MKPNTRYAALEARTVSLRASAAFSTAGVEVDEKAGIIKSAAVMTIGSAIGHGFSIDATTLEQVAALINANADGVKIRFRHPEPNPDGTMPDDIGDVIGRVKNARVEGDSVRGDVYLGDYASKLPGLGDVRSYLLSRAKQDPTGLGLSAVIRFDAEPVNGADGRAVDVVARVSEVAAVDFVGRPAANPNGLLSAAGTAPAAPTKQPAAGKVPAANVSRLQSRNQMDPKLKELLCALGLDYSASDEAATAFHNALSDDHKTELKSKLEAYAAAEQVDSDSATSAANMAAAGTTATAAPVAAVASMSARQTASRTALITDDGDKLLGRGQEPRQPRGGHPRRDHAPRGVTVEKPHERAQQLRGTVAGRHGQAALRVARRAAPTSRTTSAPPRVADLLGPRNFAQAYREPRAARAVVQRLHSILADTINKTLRRRTSTPRARGTAGPGARPTRTSRRSPAPRSASRRTCVSARRGREINYVTLSDSKETYALTEYVGGIKLTRRAIINDDLDAFSRIPMLQGNAAKRKEDDVAYAIITANAAWPTRARCSTRRRSPRTGGHATYTSQRRRRHRGVAGGDRKS